MRDSKNTNDLRPEESWLKAERILDGHFRRRRAIRWSLALFLIGAATVLTTMLVNRSSENKDVLNENLVAGESSDAQRLKKTEANSVSLPKNLETANPSPANLKDEEERKVTENKFAVGDKRMKHPAVKTEAEQNKLTVVQKNSVTQNHSLENKRNSSETALVIRKKTTIEKGVVSSVPEGNHSAEITSKTPRPELTVANDVSKKMFLDEKHVSDQKLIRETPELKFLVPVSVTGIPLLVEDQSEILAMPVEIKTPDKPALKNSLKLLAYGSAQYVLKTLESDKFPNYVERRKQEEQGIVTGSVGASVVYDMKKFSVHVGIAYSSWGERNVYSPYLNKKNAVENGSNQVFYRQMTDTFYISGNQYLHPYQVTDVVFVSHIDTVLKNTYDQQVLSANGVSKFYFIELPFELSYRFIEGKLGMGVSAGIAPAWLTGEKGYYLTRDLDGTESIEEIKSVNKFFVNGRFSFDFYYHMNPQMDFVVRPQVKASLGSAFKNEYDVNQKYYSTGLAVGLMYTIR